MLENPAWTNRTQIYEQAELEFEAAAMGLFASMLDVGKAIAPEARRGFYGYPANLLLLREPGRRPAVRLPQ